MGPAAMLAPPAPGPHCCRVHHPGAPMAIAFTHVQELPVPPARVFALIDDLPQTSRWLPPCVLLEKVGPGPNAPGDRLRYVYKQGRTQAEMAGTIVARRQDAQLHARYEDRMFIVDVDLRVAPSGTGAQVTHAISMEPRTWFGRLLAPLIRMGLRKQTTDAARNLAGLLT